MHSPNDCHHALGVADEIDSISCIGDDWPYYFLHTMYLIPHLLKAILNYIVKNLQHFYN